MGGKGAGHKSVRALLSRQANMQKARAARRRPPLPWRSGMESRVIEQLVWQWFQSSDKWRVTSDEKRQRQIPKRSGPSCLRVNQWSGVSGQNGKNSGQWSGVSGQKSEMLKSRRTSGSEALRYKGSFVGQGGQRVNGPEGEGLGDKAASSSGGDHTGIREADRRSPKGQAGTPRIIARAKERPWSAVRVARLLGVSHTWANKLVRRFEADAEGMRRKMRAFAPANLEKLERAREETRREREMGRLRGPIRWRRVKVTIQGKKMRMAAPTKEEMKRRARNAVASGVMSETKQQQVPHTAERRPVRNDSAFLPHRELPSWARGLMVTGDAGTAVPSLLPTAARRTPKPVPFAFRRRR